MHHVSLQSNCRAKPPPPISATGPKSNRCPFLHSAFYHGTARRNLQAPPAGQRPPGLRCSTAGASRAGRGKAEPIGHPAQWRAAMDEDRFNQSLRKFLKQVGVTSQREIERVVRERGLDKGALKVKVVLTAAGTDLNHVVEGDIVLD